MTCKISKRRAKFIVFVLFISTSSLFLYFTELDKKQRIESSFQKHFQKIKNDFETLSYHQKVIADSIYKSTIKNNIDILQRMDTATKDEKNLLRKKLYERLEEQYKEMQKKGILQFHFILPDNTSFLRVHKPDKFGDNLEDIRYSFKYTNKTKKTINGLETGKTSHSFKYVYPIFDNKNNYHGAMEISFTSEYLQWYMKNIVKQHIHILIKKSLFDFKAWDRDDKKVKYIKSIENDQYMNTLYGDNDPNSSYKTNDILKLKNQKNEIAKKMDIGKPFAIYTQYSDNINVIAFYPIKDIKKKENIAWLVSYSQDKFVKDTINGLKLIRIMFFLLFSTLLYFAYRVLNQSELLSIQVKEKTSALENQTLLAQKSVKAKNEFLANMSHEIRTPLNAILGFIGILKEQSKDEKSLEYLDIIDTSSNHLLGVINDILDLSKIESGKLEIENIDFETRKEFNSTLDLFQAKAHEKDIHLHIYIGKNVPKFIYSDPLRLKQIISNLLSNAIKFTPKNKNIYININYKNKKLCISVKDQGIGISKNRQKEIFHPFSQADNSTTRKFGGTGLGLSISFELVKLLGSNIKLKSKINHGSRFVFCIPIKIGKDTSINAITVSDNISFSGKVLLVEDNKANQMFMKVILKKLNLLFDIANDGLEAVELFKSNNYNAILMDENMPNMNGIEATKKILEHESKNNLKHTPIIALTANALKGDRERFLEAGCDEYLSKPINKKKLIDLFGKYLDIKKTL